MSTFQEIGIKISTIGTPIAIHLRKGTVPPPKSDSITKPIILIELPAGVATPPINAAIVMPSMSALPKLDSPGVNPSFLRTPRASVIQIAQAGTSDMIDEIAAVPNMNAKTTFFVLVPDRSSSQWANR